MNTSINSIGLVIIFSIFINIAIQQKVEAATVFVTDSSNELIGLNGVDIAGVSWDVSFVTTIPSISEFTFPTYNSATQASQALLDALNNPLDLANLIYTQSPNLTFNCIDTSVCRILTPYIDYLGQIASSMYLNLKDPSVDRLSTQPGISVGRTRVIANWSLSSAESIPILGTTWLFGLGLIGLIVIKKIKMGAKHNLEHEPR